jgi:hypothetical protein
LPESDEQQASLPKSLTINKRLNSKQREQKMRAKTAHIRPKASHASQGVSWSFWQM